LIGTATHRLRVINFWSLEGALSPCLVRPLDLRRGYEASSQQAT